MTEAERPGEPQPSPSPPAADVVQRTSMAAERTWLAWWRTALGATAGALGVGRIAPDALNVPSAPYVILGCGYGLLAISILIVGALRQRDLARAVERGEQAPLPFAIVAAFTIGGAALALLVVGAFRQRGLARAVERGEQAPLPFGIVVGFTLGGSALALMTVVLVLAQT